LDKTNNVRRCRDLTGQGRAEISRVIVTSYHGYVKSGDVQYFAEFAALRSTSPSCSFVLDTCRSGKGN
jgi:hypothetical protein